MLVETKRVNKNISDFLGADKTIANIGIISPENPMGVSTTEKENKERIKRFEKLLKNVHGRYQRVKGMYNQLEHSYIIFNTTVDDMKWYGKLFQQQSFIFGIFTEENGKPIIDFSYYGRISPDEEYEKEDEVKGFIKIPDEQTDYFTIIGKKFRFSIPFPTFMNECYYYDRMVNYRKEHSEKYKNTYQHLLNMALNENNTGKSRKIARAHLYGTWWVPLDKRNQMIDEEREFYLMDDFQNI